MTELQPARGRPVTGQAELITHRIVDAAWIVLLESGPEHFALDRVAAQAHASKQTIYTRFSGKQELLECVLAARTGLIFAEFETATNSGAIGAVIAEVTRRSVKSLSAPDTNMLERLIDWIDNSRPTHIGPSLRQTIYSEMKALLRQFLERVVLRGELEIADIDAASSFWLDGLIGHVRGVPRGGTALDEWAQTFANYFLRAVSEHH